LTTQTVFSVVRSSIDGRQVITRQEIQMPGLTEEMDSDDRSVGTGWVSGMLSIVLAVVGLSTVLCI